MAREILTTPAAIAAIARAEARSARERADAADFARDVMVAHRRRADANTEACVLRTYAADEQGDLPLCAINDHAAWLRQQHPTLQVIIRGEWSRERQCVVLELWVQAPWLWLILGDIEAGFALRAAEMAREMAVTLGDDDWRLDEPYPGVMA